MVYMCYLISCYGLCYRLNNEVNCTRLSRGGILRYVVYYSLMLTMTIPLYIGWIVSLTTRNIFSWYMLFTYILCAALITCDPISLFK